MAKEKKLTKFLEIFFNEGKDAISLAIKGGANVNEQDKKGWSALHYAINYEDVSLIELLLKNGANVDIQDVYGNTPLFRAVYNCKGDGTIIKLLLSYGADKKLKDNDGISPYDLAYDIANFPVAQFLE
ncbi:hypothetical protein FACS189462_0460 [Spirochaetia bacterium]|nr:hypothetical protein FACS189462_0460 [Spirochaetia bacterium]